MILTYQPEGTTEQRWSFKPTKIMSAEAEAIEKVTGWDFGGEFGNKLMTGSMLARRALVWVFLKRATPTLRFADVSICMDDVGLQYDTGELDAIAARRSAVSEAEAEGLDAILASHGWVPPDERGQAGDEDVDRAAPGPTVAAR